MWLSAFLFRFFLFFFFFNDTATTEIYTLSLHDALSISCKLNLSASCTLIIHPQHALPLQAHLVLEKTWAGAEASGHVSCSQASRAPWTCSTFRNRVLTVRTAYAGWMRRPMVAKGKSIMRGKKFLGPTPQ